MRTQDRLRLTFEMDNFKRLEFIAEAVRYCQRVRGMGMPPSSYTKALREPVFYLWECRNQKNKDRVAKFRSRSAVGVRRGDGALRCDHAVPFKYLQDELLKLSNVTVETIRPVLDRYGVTVLITGDDDQRLNKAGLRNKMPDGWNGLDPLARYKAVGIELVENTL
jgi:hypothetical protein